MSTKPTVGQLPTWDTSLANTIVLTAGHQTNGWANNETPTSGEANTLFAFLYLWCKYLSDGDLTGNLTATSTAESANTALVQFRDWRAQPRTMIDHLGYRGGQVSEWEEHWRASTIADWTVTNASITMVATSPSSTFKQRCAAFNVPGAGATIVNGFSAPAFTHYVDSNTSMSLEGIVQTNTTGSQIASSIGWGVQFSHASANDYYVRFQMINGTTNVQCQVVGSSTTIDDSGVAFAATTTYRLRIEITGSNNNSAGSFQAKFFINGALVVTRAFSSVNADICRPVLCANNSTSTAGFAVPALLVGRMKLNFNHVLASDTI